jgi:choice-of-anchor C domain-containing protein
MIRTLLTLVALIAFSTAANAANLVTDGDFSNPSGGSSFTTYSAGQNFGGWNVTSGSVDVIGGYWQNPAGTGGSLDLDGNTPGGISQSLLLNPGTYVLTFSLSGNPELDRSTKSLTASIAGASNNFSYTPSVNSKSDMQYVTESIQFVVSGIGPQSEILSFLSLDTSGPTGAVIGNVSLSAVPLPASLPLFGAALLGMIAYRRRQA